MIFASHQFILKLISLMQKGSFLISIWSDPDQYINLLNLANYFKVKKIKFDFVYQRPIKKLIKRKDLYKSNYSIPQKKYNLLNKLNFISFFFYQLFIFVQKQSKICNRL